MSIDFDQLRSRLREVVKITELLAGMGHRIRVNERGRGTTRCPFHDDHRPSFSITTDGGVERFFCGGCGVHGDVFDFARLQSGDPDHLSTLRRLAEQYQIPWPDAMSENGHARVDIIGRAARFYQHGLTKPVLDYLAGRGFPEAFVRDRQIGYSPIGTEATRTRLADEAEKAKALDDALAAGLVLKFRNGRLRDFFWSDLRGYIIFPNLADGKAIGLQGRAFPAGTTTRSKYLNLPGSTHQLYNPRDAAFRSVVLCEGIPDTMSAMLAKLPDTGACGMLGTQGWQDDWLRLFRRAGRVYVALDRDAELRAIDLARGFGTRGRVLRLPETLGPKGDLNDWFCGPAERDPERFRIPAPRGDRKRASRRTRWPRSASRTTSHAGISSTRSSSRPLNGALAPRTPGSTSCATSAITIPCSGTVTCSRSPSAWGCRFPPSRKPRSNSPGRTARDVPAGRRPHPAAASPRSWWSGSCGGSCGCRLHRPRHRPPDRPARSHARSGPAVARFRGRCRGLVARAVRAARLGHPQTDPARLRSPPDISRRQPATSRRSTTFDPIERPHV